MITKLPIKITINTELIQEKAPPDPKIETWIKKMKEKPEVVADFKKRYGDKWQGALYGKAWNMYNRRQKEKKRTTLGAVKDFKDRQTEKIRNIISGITQKVYKKPVAKKKLNMNR